MAADGSLRALEEPLAAPAEGASTRNRYHHADAQVVEYLRREGFAGREYRTFLEDTMTYGWRTLSAWSANGHIFERAARVGRPVPRDMIPDHWDPADRAEVVTDTVIKGTKFFHEHGLVGGKWTPDGGASLSTYFVGACVLVFPPIFISWFKSHGRGQAELDHRATGAGDDALQVPYDIPDQRATDPASAAVLRDDITRLREHLPDQQLREALVLMALGCTQAEAAAEVGLTPKALERRLARVRSKVSAGASHSQPEEGGTR